MNKQGKVIVVNGLNKVVGGIDWTKTVSSDGNETPGYTSNPLKGCLHQCAWKMPDGHIAECYAKTVAEGIAKSAYPQGFEHKYVDLKEMDNWLRVKEPSRVFINSMSDLMGTWVSDEEVEMVLDGMKKAYWHTFQLLTKNAPRLLKFKFPQNVWLGVSSPPDFFMGKELSQHQKDEMLRVALETLTKINGNTTFMSFEPLSNDVSEIVKNFPTALSWSIVGAASNGRVHYQPNPEHVNRLLDVLDANHVPVFFKSNLKWDVMRKEFPDA